MRIFQQWEQAVSLRNWWISFLPYVAFDSPFFSTSLEVSVRKEAVRWQYEAETKCEHLETSHKQSAVH